MRRAPPVEAQIALCDRRTTCTDRRRCSCTRIYGVTARSALSLMRESLCHARAGSVGISRLPTLRWSKSRTMHLPSTALEARNGALGWLACSPVQASPLAPPYTLVTRNTNVWRLMPLRLCAGESVLVGTTQRHVATCDHLKRERRGRRHTCLTLDWTAPTTPTRVRVCP